MNKDFLTFVGGIFIALTTFVVLVLSFIYWLGENWTSSTPTAYYAFLIPIIFLIFSSYLFVYLRKKSPVSNNPVNSNEISDKFHLSTVFLTYFLFIYINNKVSNFLFDIKSIYTTDSGAFALFLLKFLIFIMFFVFIMVSNNATTRKNQLLSLGKYALIFIISYNLLIFLISFAI